MKVLEKGNEVVEETVVETENDVENSDVVEENAETQAGEEVETGDGAESPDEDSFSVTIGEEDDSEEDHQDAPGWVKNVRKKNREQAKQIRELQRRIEENEKAAQPPAIEIGEEPTLEKCGYDTEVFKKQFSEYLVKKQKVEAQQAEREAIAKSQQEAYVAKLNKYQAGVEEHGFFDFDESEKFVKENFSVDQQSIIVQGAKDSALLVYALGKNKDKAEKLAGIKNPIDFAFEVARMEAKLKVENRKKAPKPETTVKGGKAGGMSGSADKVLARLRAEADKTGDYTAVRKYRKEQRNK